MVKIAVIGAGYWGKNLVRNFYELGALKTVCDKHQELKLQYLTKYPEINFIEDFQAVIEDKTIEAIVIATPAETHYDLVRQALLVGKHVFVEKPLALNVAQGEELISLAGQKDLILMVGHILHYHPAVLKLKQLIDGGELGKIQYIYSNRLNIGKIRSEENILWSFAPHDISVILMLLNEFPIHIQANDAEYLQKNVADVTLTFLRFASGVNAHIFVSWLHPFKEQKLIVVGDKQMAVFDDVCQEKLLLYPHSIEWKERVPVASKAQPIGVPFQFEEPLRAECQHFLTCIQEKKQPRTNGQEGLQVLRVLQACQESLRMHGEKVILTHASHPASVTVSHPAAVTASHPASPPEYFVHTTAEVEEGCEIGKGTKIWHFSHIMKGSAIGRNCQIGQNVVVGPRAIIGNGCKIQNNVSVYEGVTLEDDVFCGPSMVFTNVFNPRAVIPRMSELRRTLVKKGATIGANTTIVCGHTIGQYAFIGAGAVVTHDIPDFALVVGNPGKIAGWMCSCGVKINFREEYGECLECGKKYVMRNGYVKEGKMDSPYETLLA